MMKPQTFKPSKEVASSSSSLARWLWARGFLWASVCLSGGWGNNASSDVSPLPLKDSPLRSSEWGQSKWPSQGIRSDPNDPLGSPSLEIAHPYRSRPRPSSSSGLQGSVVCLTQYLLIKVLFLERHPKEGVGSNNMCSSSPILIAPSATCYDSDESGYGRGAPSLLGGDAPPCKQKINTALAEHECQ